MCSIIQRVQQKKSEKDTILSMISGFCHEVADNCTLLGYTATSSGNFLEIKEITTTCCVITQKSVVLTQYFIFKKPVLRPGHEHSRDKICNNGRNKFLRCTRIYGHELQDQILN
jgi:hypothetical protein